LQKTQAESCSALIEVDVDKSVLLSGLTSKENAEKKTRVAFSRSSFRMHGNGRRICMNRFTVRVPNGPDRDIKEALNILNSQLKKEKYFLV